MAPAASHESTGPVEGPATLAIEGRLVHGSVLSADADLGVFLFVPDEPVEGDEPPLADARARIRWGDGEGYDAEAVVVEADDAERWVLSVPVQLDHTRMRKSTRMLGEGAWSFEVEDGPQIDVYDLSERGLGLAYPRGEGPAGRGSRVAGTLVGDTDERWPVVLTCTNVRPHPADDAAWIVGGRIAHSDAGARKRLADLVLAML